MKTNTYISKDCTKKCHVFVDRNGHYELMRLVMIEEVGWELKGRKNFKKIESVTRAVEKFIRAKSKRDEKES